MPQPPLRCPACRKVVRRTSAEWWTERYGEAKEVCGECHYARVLDIQARGQLWLSRGTPPVEPEYAVELHTGFLSIIETEEQLERLRREPVRRGDSNVARSKIGNSNLFVEPVDKVAARVGPK